MERKKTQPLLSVSLSLSLIKTSQAAADALSRGEPVLLIDADATFDVERLAAALRARFRHLRGGEGGRRSEEEGEAESEPLVAAALSRFGLLKCHSALELLSALVTLRASIERLERSVSEDVNSNNQRVRLVLLDNVAAFYWPLRAAAASSSSSAAAAARRQQQTPHQQQQRLTLSTMAAASARALKRALRGSGAAALVTRHAVFPIGPPSSYPSAVSAAAASSGGKERTAGGGGGGSGGGTLREFFPAPWLSLASRRADLAPLAFAASAGGSAPRVRLTWRASATGAGGGGGDAAPPPPPLLFELTDAGLVPL